jgi:hypothetical protein
MQAAWDHLFKDNHVAIVLSGSHIGMIVAAGQNIKRWLKDKVADFLSFFEWTFCCTIFISQKE